MLDDDIEIPKEATLPETNSQEVILETSAGLSVVLNSETCLRPTGRSLVVGRQASVADVRIQHGSISRIHAALYILDNHLFLKDLGGKHGTTVNGNRVDGTVELFSGDSVLFGNVRESIFTVHLNFNEPRDEKPIVKDQVMLEQAGKGLSGRERRQAEIAAMMASLDQAPAYQTYQQPVAMPEKRSFEHQKQSLAERYQLPISQKLTLASESERRYAATCLAIDPAGSRFAVGSMDTSLRLFDFGGMNQSRMEPFKVLIPEEGHCTVDCVYSNTGDRLLVATGGSQPIVFDRDGEEIIQFIRGDMYVTDPMKTKGHTAAVACVDWHPLEKNIVLTGSVDGSARLWKLNGKTQFEKLVCDKTFAIKNMKGQKTAVTSVCFHPGGREFVVGTKCGSIQIFQRSRMSGRPERVAFETHGQGNKVDFIGYNLDGTKIISRSSDGDSCNIWNARQLGKSSIPLVVCRGLPSLHERPMVSLSPNGKVLVAGTSNVQVVNEEKRERGVLKFFQVDKEKTAGVDSFFDLDLDDGAAPVTVKWHSRLNQIFAVCSDGTTLIYYDSKMSSKGAALAGVRLGRNHDDLAELLRTKASSAPVIGEIVVPFARQEGKKRKQRDSNDEKVSRIPERPVTGKHKAGSQLGGLATFQQFVADQTTIQSRTIAGKDPREALFQYSKGIPTERKILAEKTAEQEEEETKFGN